MHGGAWWSVLGGLVRMAACQARSLSKGPAPTTWRELSYRRWQRGTRRREGACSGVVRPCAGRRGRRPEPAAEPVNVLGARAPRARRPGARHAAFPGPHGRGARPRLAAVPQRLSKYCQPFLLADRAANHQFAQRTRAHSATTAIVESTWYCGLSRHAARQHAGWSFHGGQTTPWRDARAMMRKVYF